MTRYPKITWPFAFLVLWVAVILVVNPRGEFPLNDDWSYAWSVRSLVEDHVLNFTGWVSMPLIAQIAWGSLFTALAGFSFEALRYSTLVFGYVSIISTFALLRISGFHIGMSLVGTLVLLVNPVFFSLSFTFMTDVPFTAFFVTSTALMMIGINRNSAWVIMAGLAVATLALLVRQLGLALFPGFAIGYLARNGISRRSATVALLGLLLGVGTYVGYGVILDRLEITPELYRVKSISLLATLTSLSGLKGAARNMAIMLPYFGFFILPFLVLYVRRGTASARSRVGVTLVGLVVAGLLLLSGMTFPPAGNILFQVGCGPPQLSVGPVTLRDMHVLCQSSAPLLPRSVQIFTLVISCVAGVIVAAYVLNPILPRFGQSLHEFAAEKWQKLMLFSIIAVYLVPLLLGGMFDRYLIPLLPLVLAAFADIRLTRSASNVRILAAVALLTLYGGFSVLATHDYLAWNRARWSAIAFLEEELLVESSEIDGGFEYNGWHNYSPRYRMDDEKSWWWVHDDRYVISMHEAAGFEVVGSFETFAWIPGSSPSILVLHRVDADDCVDNTGCI